MRQRVPFQIITTIPRSQPPKINNATISISSPSVHTCDCLINDLFKIAICLLESVPKQGTYIMIA